MSRLLNLALEPTLKKNHQYSSSSLTCLHTPVALLISHSTSIPQEGYRESADHISTLVTRETTESLVRFTLAQLGKPEGKSMVKIVNCQHLQLEIRKILYNTKIYSRIGLHSKQQRTVQNQGDFQICSSEHQKDCYILRELKGQFLIILKKNSLMETKT